MTTGKPVILKVGTAPSVMVPTFSITLVLFGVEAPNLIVSPPSITPSFTAGTLTKILVTLAGTCKFVVNGTKVLPPSNETVAVPVSTPTVPVPLFKARDKFVVVKLELLKFTTKFKFPPSVVTGLETLITLGLALSRTTPGGTAPVPSSRIVVVTLPTAIDEFVAPVNAIEKFSEPSKMPSLAIATVMVFVVSPGAKTKLPAIELKSLPAVAVPPADV